MYSDTARRRWFAPSGTSLLRHSDLIESTKRPDQRAKLGSGAGPTLATAAGVPVQVEAEAGAVPTDDRLGLDEHEDLGPPSPEAAQDDLEPAVGCRHPRSAACLHEDAELVPQRDVLEHQVGPATAGRTQDPEEQK